MTRPTLHLIAPPHGRRGTTEASPRVRLGATPQWLPALVVLFLGLVAGPGTGTAQTPGEAAPGRDWANLPVREILLENGLRFLVLERPTSPTVAFVSVVPVGGVNEVVGTTGIAHLLEHLLFKGTSTVGTTDPDAEERLFREMDRVHEDLLSELDAREPDASRVQSMRRRIEELEDSARTYVVPNEFDRILARAGARGLNATTTSEATTYYVELPANEVELWFALESRRMADPVFREFYTERNVVTEERRLRVENSPGGLLYEAHLAAAFAVHPYGQPVVGVMSDLEHLSRPQVREYFRSYYGAANTTIAIAGDVTAAQVGALARRYFSRVPSGEAPPPVLTREPAQRGERRVQVLFDAEPSLRMGWKVPSPHAEDGPALAILSALLTGGRTSYLYRRLVEEEQVATFISSGAGPGDRYPGLFTVDATPRAPHTAAELEARIRAALREFTEAGPDPEALERVKNQVAAGAVRRLQSNLGLALQMASSQAVLGNWRTTFRYNEAVAQVTPEQVGAAARRYLIPETLTVATLARPAGPSQPSARGGSR